MGLGMSLRGEVIMMWRLMNHGGIGSGGRSGDGSRSGSGSRGGSRGGVAGGGRETVRVLSEQAGVIGNPYVGSWFGFCE